MKGLFSKRKGKLEFRTSLSMDSLNHLVHKATKSIGELLCIIEVDATPVSITRLGQRNESKSRPIKVELSSQNEKQMVMNNLIKLKNAVDQFKKISVTADYTIEERAVISNKVAERHKTETEGEGKYIWKVRGTPKNGLHLVRFAKTKQVTPTQDK